MSISSQAISVASMSSSSPAASGGSGEYTLDFSAAFTATAAKSLDAYNGSTHPINIAGILDIEVSRMLISELKASSGVTVGAALNADFMSGIHISSAENVVHVLTLMSAAGLSGAADISHAKVLAFTAELEFGSAYAASATFVADLATAMVMRSFETYGWDFDAVDDLTLSAAFEHRYQTLLEAVSQMQAAAAHNTQLAMGMAFIAAADVSSEHDTQANFHLNLFDGAAGQVVFRIGEDIYRGWVFSTEAAAFTEYTNYPFNSFFTFNGKPYGVADDGIYLLEGEDDAGDPIEAAFKTKMTTMRERSIKDARGLYLGYTSDGQLVCKVTTTRNGVRREDWFKAQYSGDPDFRTNRMKIPRGLRSTYWQFEVANVDGADFEIEDVTIMYEVLSRRIR